MKNDSLYAHLKSNLIILFTNQKSNHFSIMVFKI